jgi:hypothetical protein
MPRYKVKCSCRDCESVWWVKKTTKLDDAAKHQLQSSICSGCAAAYRIQHESVKAGVLTVVSETMQTELDKVVRLLKENRPWGFEQTPFRDRFTKTLASDMQIVEEGITTRYRGFSPVREMLKYRYRVLAAQHALKLAGL